MFKKITHYVLKKITDLIRFHFIQNHGKFKVGDLVRFNWMAKVQLDGIIDNEVHIIESIEDLCHDYINFIDGGGTSCHWLKKA